MAGDRGLPASAVCTDVDAARVLVAAGVAVVLLGPPALGRDVAELEAMGRGRVAVMVGDPGDESDREAALEMAEEQFGAAGQAAVRRQAAVLVASLAVARDLLSLSDPGARP